MAVNEEKLNEFLGKFVSDLGAAFNAGMVVIGYKLGLYKKLADIGPMTSAELAEASGTNERYVREWLSNQAAGGYVSYEPESKKFNLSDEQAFALADEESPAFVPGAFLVATSALKAVPKVIDAFQTGNGVGWHEHDSDLFVGTEKFFRPGYAANLVSNWIPALEGVENKLKAGGKVADVGCGHGASTILMATAYPKSKFTGFDYHKESIEWARRSAEEAGVGDRAKFEVASAKDFPSKDYDFVTVFDCLHDMGDPVGASRHILESLNDDGTWMIVEPFAGDSLEENMNPVGRVFYGASTLICTPASRAQEVGLALGAQAGEANLRNVVTKGGFSRFKRATETPFNIIYEARP